MQSLSYTALEHVNAPRPVDRLSFLERKVTGKTVFDLGALDETAFAAKQTTSYWLHARLCDAAKSVVGIDNSRLIPDEGLTTSSNGRIIRANIFKLQETIQLYGVPDTIVAGELIEHLPDTSSLLISLKNNQQLKGVELLVTTPNACCWHNFLIGLAGRESMHKDHLQIYSYKTLRTLFERSEYSIESITPYHARFPEMIQGSNTLSAMGARVFQGVVNTLETITPMLSAGWVVQTRI